MNPPVSHIAVHVAIARAQMFHYPRDVHVLNDSYSCHWIFQAAPVDKQETTLCLAGSCNIRNGSSCRRQGWGMGNHAKIRHQRGGDKKYPRSFSETNPLMFDKEVHWLTNISSKIWRTQWWWITPIQSHLHRQPKAHGPGLAPAQSKASSLNNSSYVSHFASVTGEDDNIVTVSLVKRVNTMTELSYHCETRYRGWCFLDTLWLWPYESIDTNLPNVPWSCCKQSINWINATKWREEKEMNMMLVNACTTNIQRSSDILDTDTNDHKCNNACQIHSNTTFIDMVHSQNL